MIWYQYDVDVAAEHQRGIVSKLIKTAGGVKSKRKLRRTLSGRWNSGSMDGSMDSQNSGSMFGSRDSQNSASVGSDGADNGSGGNLVDTGNILGRTDGLTEVKPFTFEAAGGGEDSHKPMPISQHRANRPRAPTAGFLKETEQFRIRVAAANSAAATTPKLTAPRFASPSFAADVAKFKAMMEGTGVAVP